MRPVWCGANRTWNLCRCSNHGSRQDACLRQEPGSCEASSSFISALASPSKQRSSTRGARGILSPFAQRRKCFVRLSFARIWCNIVCQSSKGQSRIIVWTDSACCFGNTLARCFVAKSFSLECKYTMSVNMNRNRKCSLPPFARHYLWYDW